MVCSNHNGGLAGSIPDTGHKSGGTNEVIESLTGHIGGKGSGCPVTRKGRQSLGMSERR
jgi:hypothetical protein